jgi:hypothetical protein
MMGGTQQPEGTPNNEKNAQRREECPVTGETPHDGRDADYTTRHVSLKRWVFSSLLVDRTNLYYLFYFIFRNICATYLTKNKRLIQAGEGRINNRREVVKWKEARIIKKKVNEKKCNTMTFMATKIGMRDVSPSRTMIYYLTW